jgi:transposase
MEDQGNQSKAELIELVRQLSEQLAQAQGQLAQAQEQATQAHEQIKQLRERIAQLEKQVAKRSKNSSNSSKPPSSDVVKPPKPTSRSKRKIGGQPGHPRHERKPFGPDEIDDTRSYMPGHCPDCGGAVELIPGEEHIIQQVELIQRPVKVVEHRAQACRCMGCGKVHPPEMPEPVRRAGLLGPQLTALIAYLKGACHMSFSSIHKFFRDVLKLPSSRGQLAKAIAKVSDAMAGSYDELRGQLPHAPRLNVDETGHKENGSTLWTWCFRAELYTLFKIDPSRGSQVLIDMLGEEFEGVLGCDLFSAYRKYMRDFSILVQFCLAHLIRDVKFLTTLPDKATQRFGERLLDALRALFRVIHRREKMTEAGFQRALQRKRDAILAVARSAPRRSEAQNIAKRFRDYGKAYFTFITTPGVDPTNNLAEQAIRFVVIDRKVTQGTRGESGQRWCERIWTAIATCAQQGRSVYTYLYETIAAHFRNAPAPSLMPAGP